MVNKKDVLLMLEQKFNRKRQKILNTENEHNKREKDLFNSFVRDLDGKVAKSLGHTIKFKKDYSTWRIRLLDKNYINEKNSSNSFNTLLNKRIDSLRNKVDVIKEKIVFEGMSDDVLQDINNIFK